MHHPPPSGPPPPPVLSQTRAWQFITPSVTHSIIFQRGRYTNHQPGLAHGSTVLRHFKLAGVNWYGASDSFHVVTGPGSIGANCEPKPSIEFWHGPPTGSKGATNAPRYHVQNEYIEYSLESLDSEFRAAFIVWVINWTVTVSQKCGNHQNELVTSFDNCPNYPQLRTGLSKKNTLDIFRHRFEMFWVVYLQFCPSFSVGFPPAKPPIWEVGGLDARPLSAAGL